jgi:hypothetical protein
LGPPCRSDVGGCSRGTAVAPQRTSAEERRCKCGWGKRGSSAVIRLRAQDGRKSA